MRQLRACMDENIPCEEANCGYAPFSKDEDCIDNLMHRAADAIEELLKAAKAMHTWIFLNTGDEQAAYDECGLTDEVNAALGYGGQFVAKPPKEEAE